MGGHFARAEGQRLDLGGVRRRHESYLIIVIDVGILTFDRRMAFLLFLDDAAAAGAGSVASAARATDHAVRASRCILYGVYGRLELCKAVQLVYFVWWRVWI